MWLQTILLSLKEIRRNLMRSMLTILGIVIGVAAVITMVTLGTGATASVTSQVESMGSNLLYLQPGQRSREGGARVQGELFDYKDVTAIKQNIEGLAAVAPLEQTSSQAIYGNQNRNVSVYGTTNDYLICQNWEIALGQPFTDADSRSGKAVCILGSTVREKLFGGQNPIGSIIRLKNVSFKVIGVFEEKGAVGFGTQDTNDFIMVPIRALQRRISGGGTRIRTIMLSAKSGASTEKIKEDLQVLLRDRRGIAPGKEDDFSVTDMKAIVSTISTISGILTGVLSAIAGISLLVGGIGIMNIMLVSVTERTREIGIRLAIGALEKDVMKQFLIEAMVLTSLGGLIGITFGVSAAAVIAHFLKFSVVLSPGVILLAFLFSAGVGVVFGFFPARKAALLDPIEALRHE